MNKKVLVLLTILILSAMTVSAAHDTIVSITPDLANCENLGEEYTVNVENKGTSDDNIREVRIYEDVDGDGFADPGIVEFECGAAPTGWTLDDRTNLYHYCQYETTVFGGYMIEPGEDLDFTFSATLDDTNSECGNEFKVATIDDVVPIGQVVFKFPFVQVDCVDPVIDKTVGLPSIMCDDQNDCHYWITQDTVIDITASDNADQCDLGLDYCRWRYKVDDGSWLEWNIEENGPTLDWSIQFGEDSKHYIEIECYDIAGNMILLEEIDRVDDTPPITTKDFFGPQKIENRVEWIDTESTVELFPVDPDPTTFECNIGVDKTWYRNDWYPDEHLGSTGCYDPITCNPDFYGRFFDLENFYGQHEGCVNAGQESCSESLGDFDTWEDCVEAFAHGECGVDPEWKLYRGGPIYKEEESCHVLTFFSVDHLGNIEDLNMNCFFVDKTPPLVDKDNGDAIIDRGEPQFMTDDNQEGMFHWLTTSMPVTFTCTDQDPHPSGDEMLCYKVSYDYPDWGYITERYCDTPLNDDGYCCVQADPDNEFEFYFQEESMHNLEYYCVDAVEKEGDVHIQYYKVDDTGPYLTDKWIEGPYYEKVGDCPPDDPSDVCHLDGESFIYYDVEDGGDICAVDDVWCEWGYTLDDDVFYGWYQDFPIQFPEESKHDLVIRCYDALDNGGVVDEETFFVDKTPPETTLSVVGPQFPDGLTEESPYPRWVDGVTTFELTATDDVGPHDSGVKETKYRVTQVDDHYCESIATGCTTADGTGDFITYTGPFGLPESCHLIEYYSVDNVDKEETIEKQCFYSDHTPPLLEKDNGQAIDGTGEDAFMTPENPEGDFHYISQLMPITFTCTDQDPHPSGHEEFCYKVSYDYVFDPSEGWSHGYITEDYCDEFGGDYDSEWCCVDMSLTQAAATVDAQGGTSNGIPGRIYPFYFMEDSMHNLEYYCQDAVEKSTGIHTQYYKVETVPPEIIKTIVGPNIECPDDVSLDVTFTPPQQIPEDCFLIDGVTEIHVDALDPDPHPVGVEYCNWGYWWLGQYYGPYIEDAFPFIIQDWNESEHILDIHCVDYLGNQIWDVEMFLVDKTPPGIWKQYGLPYFSDLFESEGYWAEWISSDTEIFAGVSDDGPHKSGIAEVKYRYTRVDDEYCRYYRVEDVMNCEDATGSGDWNYVDPLDYSEWMFSIPQDSCHLIEIVATDNVDKENYHKQCVFVDNQAPEPNKIVYEPKDMWTPGQNGDPVSYFYPEETENCWTLPIEECNGAENCIECWEVTMTTPISLECIDPDPHPVDHETVCFNVELDGVDETEMYCDWYGNDLVAIKPELEVVCIGDDCDGDDGIIGYNMTGDGFCCVDHEITDFTFKEETEHNLKYYCVDALGNRGERIDDEKFKVTGSRFDIPLYKKWNLISVPFVLLNDNPDEVFKDLENVDSVWTYDGEADEWLYWFPGDDVPDTLTRVIPGWGYWVMELEDHELLTIGGSLFAPAELPPSKKLTPGWNLIGYYGTSWELYPYMDDYEFSCGDYWEPAERYVYGDKVYCAMNSLVDTQEGYPRWSSVWSYVNCGDHVAGWLGLNACTYGLQGEIDRMYAGRGYWVEMDVEDIYAPATTCIWNDDFECKWTGGGYLP